MIKEQLRLCDYLTFIACGCRWASLSFEEKYFALESSFLKGDKKSFEHFLNQSRLEGSSALVSCFELKLRAENIGFPEKTIPNLVRLQPAFAEFPILLGDLFFQIGFVALQAQSFGIASAFFQDSEGLFHQEDIPTYAWRSKINTVLAEIRAGRLSQKQAWTQLNNLREEFSQLPDQSRYYLCRIWFHIYSFLGAYRQGEALAKEIFLLSDRFDDIENRRQILNNKTYFSLKIRGPFGTKRTKGDYLLSESLSRELEELSETPSLSKEYFFTLGTSWREKYSQTEALYLCDILFEQLCRKNQHALVAEIIPHFENHIVVRRPNVPITQFEYFKAICARHLGAIEDWHTYRDFLEKTTPSLETPALHRKRGALDTGTKSFLVLNLTAKCLTLDGVKFYLGRVPTISKLLEVLIQKGEMIHVLDLFPLVYQEECINTKSAEARLNSLTHRVRQLVSHNVIIKNEGRLGFATNIIAKIETNGLRKNLSDQIVQVFKKNRVSLAVSDIRKILAVPRRSLQNHLSLLVKSGVLRRVGSGRSVKYSLVEAIAL